MAGKALIKSATPLAFHETRLITRLTEAATCIFHPADATSYGEINTVPISFEHFQATTATANEPTPDNFFTIQFPKGTPELDFKDGVSGKKHPAN